MNPHTKGEWLMPNTRKSGTFSYPLICSVSPNKKFIPVHDMQMNQTCRLRLMDKATPLWECGWVTSESQREIVFFQYWLVTCYSFAPPWHSWSSPERCVVPWSQHKAHGRQPGNGWGHLMGWASGKNTAAENKREEIVLCTVGVKQ